jgi:hypothetical protein
MKITFIVLAEQAAQVPRELQLLCLQVTTHAKHVNSSMFFVKRISPSILNLRKLQDTAVEEVETPVMATVAVAAVEVDHSTD